MYNRIKSIIKRVILHKTFAKMGKSISIGKGYHIIGGRHIYIGDYFSSEDHLRLQTWRTYRGELTGYQPSIVIGDNVSFMSNCQISCLNKIVIGNGCLFGDNVFITDNFHGSNSFCELSIPPIKRKLVSKGPVIVGNNVWVGRNVCIMPGVTIGDGCVIGANSVVTKSFDNNCVIAGSPAKMIKKIDR